jgi:hypothetical protein
VINLNAYTKNMDFYERYTKISDKELLDILKWRKDYQDLAVEAAVKIAIERKLIFTEQDLFSPEFEPVRTNGSKLFPEVTNEYHRQRIIGSIFRFLYMMSILPLVFAFMKYAEGQLLFTFLGAGIGMVWLMMSLYLSKSHKKFTFIPLFAVLISTTIYISLQIFEKPSFHLFDLFVLLVGTVVPVYLLLFLRRLI